MTATTCKTTACPIRKACGPARESRASSGFGVPVADFGSVVKLVAGGGGVYGACDFEMRIILNLTSFATPEIALIQK